MIPAFLVNYSGGVLRYYDFCRTPGKGDISK